MKATNMIPPRAIYPVSLLLVGLLTFPIVVTAIGENSIR